MLLDSAITLLLISGASAVVVLPPTNVAVSCQNLKVTVSWEYSEQQPQTTFRVEITSSAGNYVSETTDHQYDLSHFVWASDERYMGFNYVTVTAIQEGNLSEPVHSKSFTFSEHKTADIICKLNFPHVELKVEDSGVTVMITNPLDCYNELKQARKLNSASFKFTVSPGGEGECLMGQKICRHEIEFPEGAKQCVNLTGSLFAGNQYVSFNKIDNICTGIPTWVHMTMLIILLFVFVVIITVVSIIIYNTRAWTMKTPPLPEPLISLRPNKGKRDYYTVETTPISTVTLTVNEPCTRLSVSSEEGLEAAGLISERPKTDDYSSDGSVKTECTSIDLEELDEEQDEVCPYDRAQNLQVDMGDGDFATCYSGR